MSGSGSGSQRELKLESINEMAHPSNHELSMFYYHISEESKVNAPIQPKHVTWYATASTSQIKLSVDTLGQDISSLYERMVQDPSQYALSDNDFIQGAFVEEVDRQFPNDPNQGYRHKFVKESTINDIRKIKDMDEDGTCRAGYMVLGMKQIPTNQSSWYSFSKPKEVITDIRILISPQNIRHSISYTEKKEIINQFASEYISHKVSNEYPDFELACELKKRYSECEVMKVWDSTLDEFEGFENMSFVPFDRTPAQTEAEVKVAQEYKRGKNSTTETEEDEEWVDWD
ncbi:hypothetical protein V865_006234 [Kwoniella europaea PYCC6329]|uniref:Uncharacterized protein n=1 Tax=Kwoniella europaea PYCC6329 TaxID=1423913 RepID=A0AAX4KS75_9TREE